MPEVTFLRNSLMTSSSMPGGMGRFLCAHRTCSITGILIGEKYTLLNLPLLASVQASAHLLSLRMC